MSLTAIVMVLDRSGSMSSIRGATIEGINTFLKEQKSVEGDCYFTLVQFDDQYEVVYNNLPLVDIPDVTGKTFVPRGSTALLDAVGKTINLTREGLLKIEEARRPDRVLMVIYTDGMENASQEYTTEQIKTLIEETKEKDGWDYLYLGANQDAITVAQNMGIGSTHAANYVSTSAGTFSTYDSLCCAVKSYRCAPQAVARGMNMSAFFADDTNTVDAEVKPPVINMTAKKDQNGSA